MNDTDDKPSAVLPWVQTNLGAEPVFDRVQQHTGIHERLGPTDHKCPRGQGAVDVRRVRSPAKDKGGKNDDGQEVGKEPGHEIGSVVEITDHAAIRVQGDIEGECEDEKVAACDERHGSVDLRRGG